MSRFRPLADVHDGYAVANVADDAQSCEMKSRSLELSQFSRSWDLRPDRESSAVTDSSATIRRGLVPCSPRHDDAWRSPPLKALRIASSTPGAAEARSR